MPLERLSGRTGKFFLLNDFAFKDESDVQSDTESRRPLTASNAVSFPPPNHTSPKASGPSMDLSAEIGYDYGNVQLPAEAKQASAKIPPRIWHVPRVLVADDNLLVRTSLLHLLEKWQFNYELASCGLTAWDCLQESTFDLLLLDLQMPGMDGHELINRLRAATSNPNNAIPVIAMAGASEDGVRERMFSAGACAYLEKPLHPECLFDAVTQHINLPEHQQVRLFTDIIDQNLLDELYQGDLHHLSIMLDLFLQNTPQMLQQLQRALLLRNGDMFGKALHSVKPTFAMVGLPQLTDMAGELEAYLEEHDQQLDGKFGAGFVQFYRFVQRALEIIDERQQALQEHLK
ncbi:MAG: response regulator [Bacteroidota bacterium]